MNSEIQFKNPKFNSKLLEERLNNNYFILKI